MACAGLAALLIFCETAAAQPARLAKDIHPPIAPDASYAGSSPTDLTIYGGSVYFDVSYQYSGLNGLWRTDGTPEGTHAVLPRRASDFAVVGGALFFLTGDGLWKTDGTAAGSELVRAFDECGSNARATRGPLVEVGGTLFFVAFDSDTGDELWKSDGTAAGTQLVEDEPTINTGAWGPIALVPAGGKLVYFRADFPDDVGLWVSDGTEGGTSMLKRFNLEISQDAVSTGAFAFFYACDESDCGLWRTDGTALGTILLANGFIPAVHAVGSRVYFSHDDGIHGRELWTSDGSVQGTQLLLDRNPAGSSEAWGFESFAGTAWFFLRTDLTGPAELWRTDGSSPGTELVANFGDGLSPGELESSGSTLFIAFPNENQLWTSDGTTPGTHFVVSPPLTQLTDVRIGHLRSVPGGVVFVYDDGTYGPEIWKSDGTAPGTVLLKDINPEWISSEPRSFGDLNGTLLCSADDGTHGHELWRSRGEPHDTSMVKDLSPGPGAGSVPAGFATLGGVALYAANGVTGRQLWRTDGTDAGTWLVKDFSPFGVSNTLISFGSQVVFGAANGLWTSDGTEAGTTPLANDLGVYPWIARHGNALYFLAIQSGQNGLWKTDGTSFGTVLVAPLNVAVANDFPRDLTASGAFLYFNVCEDPFDCALWKSDGTGAGTGLFRDSSGASLTDVNGVLFFGDYAEGGLQLWKTDGTEEGTEQLTFGDGPWPFGPSPAQLTNVGGTLFLRLGDCEGGEELWKSDGTVAGTVLVRDIWPGAAGSSPRQIVAVGNIAVFWATDPEHGEELWKSDGTEEGTLLFQDIEPGPGSAGPFLPDSRVVGNRLYFSASDLSAGTELWSIDTRMITSLAISPTSGPAAGGTTVAVSGNYPEGTTVDIGGLAASDAAIGSPSYLTATSPALAAGTTYDVVVSEPGSAALVALPDAWFADFLDVSTVHPFHDYVESIVRAGISAGCGFGNYCPANAVTRAQMAAFLLKAKHGSTYLPPQCTGIFSDTPCPGPFTDWVEQLAAEGVTSGCGAGVYCPSNPVTRAHMAVFLLKTKEGSAYVPPAAVGVFGDVPAGNAFAPWIEGIYTRGITGGCSAAPLLYCPGNAATRGQMAVFLVRMFGL